MKLPLILVLGLAACVPITPGAGPCYDGDQLAEICANQTCCHPSMNMRCDQLTGACIDNPPPGPIFPFAKKNVDAGSDAQ